MPQFYYRRKNPEWCRFALGLCWDWANKLDHKCDGCSYNNSWHSKGEGKDERANNSFNLYGDM